ncbi:MULTISPECIES: DUF6769 family protein [Bacteroidales]|uniref:Uncharacterized protein n=1 Tax=bioreactor metagenome TaxID=1076179 RepID=A0A644WYE1_9ZZZZ|nr:MULTISPECIES: DUF6769 family protein [Bacteroidales]MDD4570250.1 hypothetical protein [Tepidanaerobacteraceae bacterium]MDH6388054.1 hypothetical protein [Dysgonomonas sp. PH5-37]MDL2262303.1 hypothetical protein [Bacteroidales bacterium OttesenSCG-928-I21]MDU1892970.1 DUF6769 family protein [Dysgonomonas sp.]OJV78781.1 MAG: hypothetical protein BGO34_02300 [Bacteroidia bacterium 44-10]
MKNKCSISAIVLSTILFLVFAVIPHHHHGGKACIVIELCELDNAINDEHTHHSDTDSEQNHDETCIAKSKFIIPTSVDETKLKVSDNQNDTVLFPIFFLVGNLFNYSLDSSFIESDYGEYILSYKSAAANQFHGLRAPPFTFS